MCYVINLNLIEEIFHGKVGFIFFSVFRLNIFKQKEKTKNEHIYTDKTNNNKQENKKWEKHIKITYI